MKKALWLCTDKLTEDDRKKIITLAGEKVEFEECHIPITSYDIINSVLILRKLIKFYKYEYVITAFEADITFHIWSLVDGMGISYFADKNKISRTSAPSREFIKIINASDITSHRTDSEIDLSNLVRTYGSKHNDSP